VGIEVRLKEVFVTENSRHIQRTRDHDFYRFLVVCGLTSVRLGTATLNKNRVLGRNIENQVYKQLFINMFANQH
jgi:hypothetical protein